MNVRGGERFSKQMRLRKRSEYLRVQTRGQKVQTNAFLGLAVFGVPKTRIGITVTKRIGGAATRNRIRRLVREAFRRRWMVLPDATELVIIAKKQAATLDGPALIEELSSLGRRLQKLLQRMVPCGGLLSR